MLGSAGFLCDGGRLGSVSGTGSAGTATGSTGFIMLCAYGVSFLRNLLFLSVSLPDPSTLTTYWSWSLSSTTTPVMSHLDGWLPTWFWTNTLSPTASLGRALVFLLSLSMLAMERLARAFSLSSASMIHSG